MDNEPTINNINSESRLEKKTQEYNNFLTKKKDLENNPHVTIGDYTTINGQKVKQYNLEGTKFAFLTHTIGLNIANDNKKISEEITNDISIWNKKNREEGNNQISCSLITDKKITHTRNAETYHEPQIILAFEQIEKNGLLFASVTDGAINTNKGIIIKPNENNIRSPQEIINIDSNQYNEVVISRYPENEQARKPDFIVIFDGQTNDKIDQAVDYFNIPIINLQTEEYIKDRRDRIETNLIEINSTNDLGKQKEIFSEIIHSLKNKYEWENLSKKNFHRDDPKNVSIRQKIIQIEESIIDKQLIQDKEEALIPINELKEEINLTNLQNLHKTIIKLVENTYNKIPSFIALENNGELYMKWKKTSFETLSGILSLATPEIKTFYQNKIEYFSENPIEKLQQELENFKNFEIVSINKNTPELIIEHGFNGGKLGEKSEDISRDPFQRKGIVINSNLEKLKEIFTVQEELKKTITSKKKRNLRKN